MNPVSGPPSIEGYYDEVFAVPGLIEEMRSAGAVDKSEWVSQIRTVTTLLPPYQLQEDGHPSYWGQLALRNCLRQAYYNGAPRGGTCTIGGTGLNSLGEPVMAFG